MGRDVTQKIESGTTKMKEKSKKRSRNNESSVKGSNCLSNRIYGGDYSETLLLLDNDMKTLVGEKDVLGW